MKTADPDLVGLLCRWFSVPFLSLYMISSITAVVLSVRKRRREKRAASGGMQLATSPSIPAAEPNRSNVELDLLPAAEAQGG